MLGTPVVLDKWVQQYIEIGYLPLYTNHQDTCELGFA